MKALRSSLRVVGGLAVLLYAGLALLGCTMADKMIFQPQRSSYDTRLPNLEQVAMPDGTSLAVLFLPNPGVRHTILYFHGNAEDLGNTLPILRQFQADGFSVLSFDYRGYGRSEGKPSEEKIYADTDAVLAFAQRKFGVAIGSCIAVGRSVGSGPAVDLAKRASVSGLVLISPFTSTFRVMTKVKLLPFDRFDNLAKISQVQCPVLIFHGTADEVIPFAQGEKLFASANEPKRPVWITGARHNDIFHVAGAEIFREIRDFGAKLPGSAAR